MDWLEKWLFPPTCVITQQPTIALDIDPLFISLWQRYGDACPCCANKSIKNKICHECKATPRLIDRTKVAFAFRGELRKLVHQYKYQEQLHLSQLFARLMTQQLELDHVDALIPIPLHPGRLVERGYNQAFELARLLGKDLSIPVYQTLIRTHATVSQTQLSWSQRQLNLKQAFALNPKAKVDLQSIQTLALVDDVITTGATLKAAASLLKAHYPDLKIQAWALAKTR